MWQSEGVVRRFKTALYIYIYLFIYIYTQSNSKAFYTFLRYVTRYGETFLILEM
jgi:hypothetical protein